MGDRIAGVGSLTLDGTQVAVKANLVVSPDPIVRTGIAGQDRVHGFQELPRVPFIEADLSITPDLSEESLVPLTNSTVIAQLADNRTFVLHGAWYVAQTEINTHDGQFKARFEGISCNEIMP